MPSCILHYTGDHIRRILTDENAAAHHIQQLVQLTGTRTGEI